MDARCPVLYHVLGTRVFTLERLLFDQLGQSLRNRRTDVVSIDLPCSRCGSSLRGRNPAGQCPECGLSVASSLSVAALRSGDPGWMESIASGIDAQVWGTLLGAFACVVGPFVVGQPLSIEAFAVVVTVAMSLVGVWHFGQADKASSETHAFPRWCALGRLAIPLGSAALVVPALLVHARLSETVGLAALVSFLIGGACWFIGECTKLRLLEHLARLFPGRDLGYRARHVRWGAYVALMLLAAALVYATWQAHLYGLALPQVSGFFLVTASVALLVFTLLTTLLASRMSAVAIEQAGYVRKFLGESLPLAGTALQPLPDFPEWAVEA